MKRRDFLNSALLTGIALTLQPVYATTTNPLPFDELVGKGNPTLFGDGYQLRKPVYEAFLKMQAEAAKQGINIQVVSSYRNYNHQNRIWSRKYERYINQGLTPTRAIDKIIEYSTIPGTSRHHWGTDLDIIDGSVPQPKNVLSPEHFENKGPFTKFKQWMDKHSESFGFYLVYTNNPNRKGFKYEPWHFSYKPLSKNYLKEYQKINLLEFLKTENISGSEFFTEDFIKRYLNQNILDINPDLL